jgi:hypothetical protein
MNACHATDYRLEMADPYDLSFTNSHFRFFARLLLMLQEAFRVFP